MDEELERLTAPVRYEQIMPLPRASTSTRTREHRCGHCSWAGTGSTECKNYRPSQTVPYEDGDDDVV